jgi:hypothetical protein
VEGYCKSREYNKQEIEPDDLPNLHVFLHAGHSNDRYYLEDSVDQLLSTRRTISEVEVAGQLFILGKILMRE